MQAQLDCQRMTTTLNQVTCSSINKTAGLEYDKDFEVASVPTSNTRRLSLLLRLLHSSSAVQTAEAKASGQVTSL